MFFFLMIYDILKIMNEIFHLFVMFGVFKTSLNFMVVRLILVGIVKNPCSVAYTCLDTKKSKASNLSRSAYCLTSLGKKLTGAKLYKVLFDTSKNQL